MKRLLKTVVRYQNLQHQICKLRNLPEVRTHFCSIYPLNIHPRKYPLASRALCFSLFRLLHGSAYTTLLLHHTSCMLLCEMCCLLYHVFAQATDTHKKAVTRNSGLAQGCSSTIRTTGGGGESPPPCWLIHDRMKEVQCMQGTVVQQLDSRGEVTRAEGVKDWLLNKFGFCLLHQGPFCAALLLQVLAHVFPMLPGLF